MLICRVARTTATPVKGWVKYLNILCQNPYDGQSALILIDCCPLMQSEGRLNKFGPVQSSSEVHFVTVPLTNLVVSKYYTDYKSHIIEEMQFAWCQVGSSTAATKWVRNFCSTDPAPLIKYFDWPTPPPVPSYDNPL